MMGCRLWPWVMGLWWISGGYMALAVYVFVMVVVVFLDEPVWGLDCVNLSICG